MGMRKDNELGREDYFRGGSPAPAVRYRDDHFRLAELEECELDGLGVPVG
jgi:hypothetical protein